MIASSWIWQQPDWPRFRWQSSALEPLLEQARAARQELLSRLERLEPPLDREAISALLGRESLGTAAIEGELLDVLLEATSTLDEPLTLVTLNPGTSACSPLAPMDCAPFESRAGAVRAGSLWPGWPPVSHLQVPHHDRAGSWRCQGTPAGPSQ